jgi:N-succinyl-L-ornithine transcarbamylase
MNHFTSVKDVKDLNAAVEQALTFKKDPSQPHRHAGKRVGLIFFNPSLRTRLSSIVAAQNLGAEAIVLDVNKDGWALEYGQGVKMDGDKAEHIKEAAAVMGAYFDLLAIRTFPSLVSREEDYSEVVLNSFIEFAGVPIVSLESATGHPLQAFADLITIKEQWLHQRKPKVVLSWAPHVKALPQAVPNSFAQWMNAAELDLTITHPRGYELSPEFAGKAQVTYDQKEAFQSADFVYVKNWSSFQDYGQVLSKDEDWRITLDHLKNTNQAKVMHCLPVRRGLVIDDEVLDSPNAIHIQQAENRVYAAQTVINTLL